MSTLAATTTTNNICAFWHSTCTLNLYGLIKMGHNFGITVADGDFFISRDSSSVSIQNFFAGLQTSLPSENNVSAESPHNQDVLVYYMVEACAKSYLFKGKNRKNENETPTEDDMEAVASNGESHDWFKWYVEIEQSLFFCIIRMKRRSLLTT